MKNQKKIFIFAAVFVNFGILQAAEIKLPHIFNYIDSPVVEQRQIFTSEEIEELQVQDLPSLMVAAGVQILSYGPYGLEQKPSIRGFTDETVRVIIDGICVNNAQYGTFDFSSINIEDIEKIEIVRGGFTEGVSDEGAVGGAIYITTKKQSLGHNFYFDSKLSSFFNLNVPVDSFSQTIKYDGQFSDRDFFKASFKGTFAANKYLFTDYKNRLVQRENAQVLDGNSTINYFHYFGDGNSFGVNNLFYAGNKNTPGVANSDNFGKQKDFDNNLSAQVILPAVLDCLRVENIVSWLSNTRFYIDKISDSEHYVNSFKYFGNFDFYKFENFENITGLTFDYTHLDSTDDGIHDQFSGTLKSTSKFTLNSFVITVPLAVKFCNENFAFSPKLGLGVKTKYLDVFVDGYRMIQFPNMDDLYWDDGINKGNPDLLPESGWGGDLTINGHDLWLPFSLCVFSNFYENKIQWASSGSGWTPQNVASAFYLGVDASFEKSFWKEIVNLKGNVEYLYTKLLDKTSINYGKKIMWTPDFVGSLSCIIKIPATKILPESTFTIDTNYVGKRYISNLNTRFMEPYVLVNLIAQTEIELNKWKLTPYARIDNLLDTNYQAVDGYPMPGISATIGCRINGRF